MADPREALGKTERECLKGNFGDNAATDGHSVLKTGQPIISKCDEWKRDDGTVRWYASTRVPVRNPVDQHIDGLVGISRDITEEKQIENHLRVAKETAEETVRAKQEFLARTSHEIRTPLNSILGMTEVLSETGLSEQQKRYIGVLRTNSEMLMRLLTDLLDLSRGDLHELTLVATAFDTREIVGSVIEYFKQDAFRKGVDLLLEVADNVPFRLIGDSGRLTQILSNLVNNALKFTDLGRITIKVNCTSIENQSVLLDFSVEDTGIGIAPDKLDAIFEPFSQAEEFITGRYGGSGLGLTICRQLVHQMGGTISVQSSLGEASIFRFTTRFLLAGEERPAVAISNHPALIQKSLSGLTVLMAEDNVDNIFLMQVYLGPARMEIAVNGREAVDRFMAGRFDVVLMDLQMPEMDGLQATRLIRQWEQHHKKPPTPILACTAHEFSEEASLRAGCTGHLIKPITRETLLAAIDRCVSVSN
jgi:signal transduction histidine kinase